MDIEASASAASAAYRNPRAEHWQSSGLGNLGKHRFCEIRALCEIWPGSHGDHVILLCIIQATGGSQCGGSHLDHYRDHSVQSALRRLQCPEPLQLSPKGRWDRQREI